MKCLKARRLFGDYLDRRLDPGLRQALKHHLAACAECRAELGALRRATDLLHGAAPPEPPPDFGERIKRSLAAAPRPAPVSPVWRVARLAGAVAAAVLVVGSVRWYMGRPLAELPPLWPEVTPKPLVVRKPADQPVTVGHVARDFAAVLTASAAPCARAVRSERSPASHHRRRQDRLAKSPARWPSLAIPERTNGVSARVVEETAALAPLLVSRLQPAAVGLGDAGLLAETDSAVADQPKIGTALASYFQPTVRETPAVVATAAGPYALDLLTADCQVPGL